MKFLWNKKDGGPESKVWMYGIESKRFGSLLLLRFENGSREAYHSHAFNARSILLSGLLDEYHFVGGIDTHLAGDVIRTSRNTFHKVYSLGRSWVLSARGAWTDTWQEALPCNEKAPFGLHRSVTLTHGRELAS